MLTDHHDVLAELLPELGRGRTHPAHRLEVVTIDMEDWRAYALGDVGGVGGGARKARVRGEADLVDDVDGAPTVSVGVGLFLRVV